MSVRLYIGNLPKEEVDRQELQAVFAEVGMLLPPKSLKTENWQMPWFFL